MTFAKSDILHSADLRLFLQRLIFAAIFLFLIVFSAFAQTSLSQPDEKTIVVEEAKEMEVFSIGKTVIVKREAKGVLALGGDVIIEGRVEGDVATIGGSVIQKENAFIGGDVIIFGGTYKHEASQPLRNPSKQTVMYAGYEEELRNLTQSPSQIFAPKFSWSFLAQRILSVLFWFIVSLALTTLAPGAVSRAVVRFQLSTLKVFGRGLLGIFVTTFGVLLSLSFLPNYVGAIVSLMAFVLLMLAYVFGRVALQASMGKWIQKRILPDKKQSETVALLIGAVVWALLLSIPYVWTFTLLALFAASLGLVLTARSSNNWQKV